jgi:hypothetical protein
MAYEGQTTTVADHVLEDFVDEERGRNVDRSVADFTAAVQRRAEERVAVLQQSAGAHAKAFCGELMAKAKGYADSRREMLGNDANVGDTASKNAAAYVDMGSRKKTFDDDAMAYELSAGQQTYWHEVNEHEDVHKHDQSSRFNTSTLNVVDPASGAVRVYKVEGSLTEGQATQKNTRGLTTEYRGFQQDWRDIRRVVDEREMERAMKTGDILSLQRRHYAKVFGMRFAAPT